MSKTFKYTIVLWFLFINVSYANVIDVDNTQLKKLIKADISIVDIRTINEWNYTGVIPNSLLITFFDEKGNYNQKDAEGFIKINSLRFKNKN